MAKIVLSIITLVIIITAGAVFFKTQIQKSTSEKIYPPVVPQVKSTQTTVVPRTATSTAPQLQTGIESSIDAELASLDTDISDIGQYNQDTSLDTMGNDISAVSQ